METTLVQGIAGLPEEGIPNKAEDASADPEDAINNAREDNKTDRHHRGDAEIQDHHNTSCRDDIHRQHERAFQSNEDDVGLRQGICKGPAEVDCGSKCLVTTVAHPVHGTTEEIQFLNMSASV